MVRRVLYSGAAHHESTDAGTFNASETVHLSKPLNSPRLPASLLNPSRALNESFHSTQVAVGDRELAPFGSGPGD